MFKGRVDWGNTYASKSFFDAQLNRRVLFGWIKVRASMLL